MNTESLAMIAGMISSMIFVSSNVPMLWKAHKTKDLHSYSWLYIVLINAGNLIYWIYVATLPLGPVWFMHTFYTLASGLLLFLYWRHVLQPKVKQYIGRHWRRGLASFGDITTFQRPYWRHQNGHCLSC